MATNKARTELREKSFISKDILKSQQPCSIKDNHDVLIKHTASLNCVETINNLKGLQANLEMLLAQVPCPKRYEVRQSYVRFE